MYNNLVRDDSFRNATAEETVKFYDAYYQFNQMMYRPENVVHHQLTPGEIIQFHNLRVLHGRTAFTLESEKASRWLHGIYFEWDVVFSKLRVLHGKLGLKTPHLHEQSDDFF